tara:strand:- start:40991 stop:42013 length:1023 start_codon:yes stop_codon:yes gene_type:complete
MKEFTRRKLDTYMANIASLNGVSSVEQKFTVEPTVQQRLEDTMAESSALLSRINVVPVDEMKGEKIGLGVPGTIASNTDTSTSDRQTQSPFALSAEGYEVFKNNFDTHITYQQLDMWAKFPNFQKRVRNHELKAQELDRCRIAWNGVSRAANTNRTNFPLLEDVNTGFLHKYRTYAADRVLDTDGVNAGEVHVYEGADEFQNLDALIMDAVNNLIDPWYREDDQLVVIIGRSLFADKYFPLVNKAQPNSEKMAADMIISQKRIGNIPATQMPFFPTNSILVTSLDNLSLYYQSGARRRHIQDNPKRDRIENYESSNDDYIVEDYGRGCLIENIVTTAPAG